LLLPYILFEKYIYILALEMASQGNEHCANCIGTLSFRIIFKGHVIANGYAIGRVRPPVHLFPLYLLNELTRGLDFCITIARQGQWSDDRARGGAKVVWGLCP